MHPKTLFILLISLLLQVTPSFSQNKLIKGQIIVHNSKTESGKKKFVPNSKGRFKLKLKNVDPNEPLVLKVEKKGYEVVNLRDIKYLLLDDKSWLRILMAKKGYVKRVRNALIATAKKTLMKEQKQLLSLIQTDGNAALPIFEDKFGRRIRNLYEADQILADYTQKLEENMRYCSYELVIVNPDEASDFYLSAMRHYRQGDFEMAIKTLQKEKVEKSVSRLAAAVDQFGDNQIQINRLIENKIRNIQRIKNNYIFQIIALQQSFRIKEAAVVIQKLEEINDIAASRKYQEIIERLNSFEVEELLMIDENRFVKEKPRPVFSEANYNNNQPRRNTVPKSTSKFQTNDYQSPQHEELVNYHRKKLVRPQESFSQKQVAPERKQEAPVVSYGNVSHRNNTSQPAYNTSENVTPPNVSHSVVNNGSSITITTKITTDPNGAVRVNTNINENNPTSVITQTTPIPNNYEHLTAKGAPIPQEEDQSIHDFETVIFPTKNATKQFKSFLETEKKENLLKWKKSNKFR